MFKLVFSDITSMQLYLHYLFSEQRFENDYRSRLTKKKACRHNDVSPWSSPLTTVTVNPSFITQSNTLCSPSDSRVWNRIGWTSNEETCNYAPRWPSFAVYCTYRKIEFLSSRTRLWMSLRQRAKLQYFAGYSGARHEW